MWIYVDSSNRILSANESDMSGNTGWEQVDCTVPEILFDDRSVPMYQLSGAEIIQRTAEEMDADYTPPEVRPSTEERVNALENMTDDIILMMAEIIGG